MKIKQPEYVYFLDNTVNQLLRTHGVFKVLKSVIASCDTFADFHHLSNDKKLEDYWRRSAIAIFDAVKHIDFMPGKSRKF